MRSSLVVRALPSPEPPDETGLLEPAALSLEDGARFLGLNNVEGCRWLIRTGRLKAAHLGRRIVVPLAELRRLLAENTK